MEKRVEELGYKAYAKGFFNEWTATRSSLIKERDLDILEAAERAYTELKSKLVTPQ